MDDSLSARRSLAQFAQDAGLEVRTARDGLEAVEPVDAPVPRRLALLRGNLEELLWRGDLAQHEQSWCQVTLTDPHRPARAIDKLRTRFPHTLELRFEPVDDLGRVVLVDRAYTQRLAGRDDLAVCTSFLEHVRSRPADDRETSWLSQALTASRLADLDARGVSVLHTPRHRADQASASGPEHQPDQGREVS